MLNKKHINYFPSDAIVDLLQQPKSAGHVIVRPAGGH
jgi:hypothetical protein